ncbi:MAG: DUF58 domain-containing protein [Woeseiaceae bacterium]
MRQPLLNEKEILQIRSHIKAKKRQSSHHREISHQNRGDVRSRHNGHGMDYEESRLFQQGDDPRYMNWQHTARTGQNYIKVYREERQPGVFILIDKRSSMRFGTKQRLKMTQAVIAGALIAFNAQENNHSLAGVLMDDDLVWIKENKTAHSAEQFISQAVIAPSPVVEVSERPPLDDEPSFEKTLKMLNEILITGSKLYIVSDFSNFNDQSKTHLLKLTTEHEVLAYHIIDPAEKQLPNMGEITLKAKIKGIEQQFDSRSKNIQTKYSLTSEEYFASIQKLITDLAIPYKQILTTDNLIDKKSPFI